MEGHRTVEGTGVRARERPLRANIKSYRADIADAFHALLRRALAADGALEGTVLIWRATVFVCTHGLYGKWLEAAVEDAETLATPRAAGSAVCEDSFRGVWDAAPEPAWGRISLTEACSHGRMNSAGSEWLNDLAAQAVRLLNRCYLSADDGALPRDFPCPADLRGLALRRPWRLPGVYFSAYNALSQQICGRIAHADGVHMDQSYLPLLRSLLAATGPGENRSSSQ